MHTVIIYSHPVRLHGTHPLIEMVVIHHTHYYVFTYVLRTTYVVAYVVDIFLKKMYTNHATLFGYAFNTSQLLGCIRIQASPLLNSYPVSALDPSLAYVIEKVVIHPHSTQHYYVP